MPKQALDIPKEVLRKKPRVKPRAGKARDGRHSEDQLRFITDHVPVFIVHCDTEARFTFVNAPYAERFGLSVDQIVGKRIPELVGEAAYESFKGHVESALAGKRVEFEQQIPYHQLGFRWVQAVYTPQKDNDGNVIGFVAVIQDVTGAKLAQERMRFLCDLSERIRTREKPDDLIRTVTEGLGTFLNAARCGLAEINVSADRWTISSQFRSRGIPPIFGTHSVKAFDAGIVDELRAGRIVHVADTQKDPRTAARYGCGYLEQMTRSLVCVPLWRGGRFVAFFGVTADVVREWSPEEVVLIETVAERAWAALERLQAAAELRASQARMSALIEQLPVGVGLTDEQGNWTLTNAILRRLVGPVIPSRDPEAIQRWRAYGADGQPVEQNCWPAARALRGETVHGMDFLHSPGTGKELWIRVSATPFRDGNGLVLGAIAVFENIDEQKRADRALKIERELLQTIIDRIPVMLTFYNPSQQIIRTNTEFERVTGWSSRELSGKHLIEECYPAPEDRQRAGELMQSGPDRWMDLRLRTRDGRLVETSWARVQLSDSTQVGIGIDITERKRAEEALRDSHNQLANHAVQLEKLVQHRTANLREMVNELEAFSYSIAHDMRAPLRAMAGFAGLLISEHTRSLDSAGKDYLRRITAAASRMDKLIVDILDYTRIVRGDLELRPLQLRLFISDIITTYPSLSRHKADIIIDDPLPPVMANEAALTQVVSNLLGNAVKFTRPGVRPIVRVRSEQADGFVRLWFEDNGIGIPKESQQRLFQLFTRLNRPEVYEGTGIGLAIVRKAVERMGGTVGIESEQGCGSRFWVQLRVASGI